MRELAEATSRFEAVAADETLIECDQFVIFFAPGNDARSCTVQRPRFDAVGLEATVAHARGLICARGRHEATWEILVPVHSAPTLERLQALGMHPATPPSACVMVLSSAPLAGNPQVVVRAVDTVEDFKAHVSITHEVFGALDRLPAELARIDADGARKLADRSFMRYVARIDGEPVGAATATFTAAGVMLHSGSTLTRYRGRGAYAAMVAHRWQEAVARGTPQLVTRAGPMSRGILQRLGFGEIAQIHFLVDRMP